VFADYSHLKSDFRETAQAIKGIHIRKATKHVKDVTVKKQYVPFWHYNGGVGSVPKPNSGARDRVSGPERVLKFCCTCLKMQSNADLRV
jgi:large subunit ribosomal protein L17e